MAVDSSIDFITVPTRVLFDDLQAKRGGTTVLYDSSVAVELVRRASRCEGCWLVIYSPAVPHAAAMYDVPSCIHCVVAEE